MQRAAFLLLLCGVASCGPQPAAPAAAAAPANSLVGSWRLTALATSCNGCAPLPDEVFILTADHKFQVYLSSQLASEGTYTLGTGSVYGGAASPDSLLRTVPTTPNTSAPAGNYTLRADVLVIDQGQAVDAPRYTFRRQH